ncbi:MAG: hypothetical protein GYA23_02410, partial [Methanomicrobiales archaeon]|nr:hypothetical protein [Methanomicrobiales archaeon]
GTVCPEYPANSLGGLCSQGTCYISQCKPNFGDCNKVTADGCEVNLRSDGSNCGACGNACSAGQKCTLGQCV